jgi:hypothetical protein
MNDPLCPFDALLDLDARHDELLRQLAELDQRVERVLAEYLPAQERSRQVLEARESISLEPPAAAA